MYIKWFPLQRTDYLPVDPHVMATPSLADINNDGRTEELIVPVSYFYEEDDYRYNHLLLYSFMDPTITTSSLADKHVNIALK